MSLTGGGAHLLDPFDGLKLLLHRSHQQTLGILRRDPFVSHRDIDNRNGNIRFCLLGNSHIGDRAADEQHQQQSKNSSRAAECDVNECLHGRGLLGKDHIDPIAGSDKTLANGYQLESRRQASQP